MKPQRIFLNFLLVAATLSWFACENTPAPPTPDPNPVDTTAVDSTIVDTSVVEPPIDTTSLSRIIKTKTGFKGFPYVGKFPESDNYYPVDLAIPDDFVIITPDKVDLINSPKHQFFILVPGEYGDFIIAESNRTIIADPGLKEPWNDNLKVTFSTLEINASNITLDRINVDARGQNDKSATNRVVRFEGREKAYADRIIFNRCEVQNQIGYGYKMFATNSAFQDCLLHDKGEGGFDMGGIVWVTLDGKPAPGNRVIGCEIYNWTDAIATPIDTPKDGAGPSGSTLPDLLIENCDLYITEELHKENQYGTFACAEDGVDFKTGGSVTQPATMRNCRIWGMRATDQSCGGSGSPGTGIVLHLAAQNWVLENNIIFDCNEGVFFTDESKPKHFVDNVIFRNNLIFDIQQNNPFEVRGGEIVLDREGKPKENQYSGGAFRSKGDVDLDQNTVVNCYRLHTHSGSTKSTFTNNMYGCIFKEGTTCEYGKSTTYEFWIKRLTGPERVTVTVPID